MTEVAADGLAISVAADPATNTVYAGVDNAGSAVAVIDASQQWTAATADGIFTDYVNANGLCLDNTGDSLTDGNRVQVWARLGDRAQQWYGPGGESGS